jgi:5'-3' exonuclease
MFRAFFGLPETVRSPSGVSTNAIRGFLDMLARLVRDRKPRRLLVATDEDWRPEFRTNVIPTYKAHRVDTAMPAGLEPQVPVIEDVLKAIGIDVVGADGFEAEDVIASLLPQLSGKIEIVTGDRDLFALVRDPEVSVLYTQQGIGKLVVVDEAEIERRYAIPGRSYGDFAVLRGDPSDGLPGVPGVGEKTAAQLVRRFRTLEAVMESGRLGEAANAYIDRARQVGVPVATAPVRVPQGLPPTKVADPEALQRLQQEFGIDSPVERLVQALKLG